MRGLVELMAVLLSFGEHAAIGHGQQRLADDRGVQPRRRHDVRGSDRPAKELKRRDRLVDVRFVADEAHQVGKRLLLVRHDHAPPPSRAWRRQWTWSPLPPTRAPYAWLTRPGQQPAHPRAAPGPDVAQAWTSHASRQHLAR